MSDQDQIITSRTPEIERDAIAAGVFVGLFFGGFALMALIVALAVSGPPPKDHGQPCSDVLMKRTWGAGIACRAEAERRLKSVKE